MLEAPGRVLPRPMSVCLAAAGELAFLIDPIGPGTRALCALEPRRRAARARPARQRLRPRRRAAAARRRRDRDRAAAVPVAGSSDGPPAILGFRSELARRGGRAAVPDAEVCIEPTYVTALLPEERHDVLACGPEPMLAALRGARAGRAARVGGADGVRLRRLLRLRGRDRRRAEAPLRRRASPGGALCC